MPTAMPIRLRACSAVLLLALGACRSWQPQPALTPQTRLTGDARVTRADNSVVVLRSPAIAADSLSGRTGVDERLAIPLSDVRAVHTRRFDTGRTVVAVGAAALAALLIRSALSPRVVYSPN